MRKQARTILAFAILMTSGEVFAQKISNNKEKIMTNNSEQNEQLRVAKSYYEKINSGDFNDDSYFDLFTEDVKIFYPKFGFAEGKLGVKKFGQQVRNLFNNLTFELDKFNFIVTDNTIVVEGVEIGAIHTGAVFPDNEISFGKFCTVFEFEGNRIKRMYCYVDPDHAGQDKEVVDLLKSENKNLIEIEHKTIEAETKKVVDEFYEIQSGKKQGSLADLFADMVDFDLPGHKEKFPWTGKRQTKKEVEDYFKVLYQNIKSLKFDVEYIAINGENAVAVGQLSSVILKYNKVFNAQFVNIFKIRNGKIVKYHFMEDSYRLNEEMK
ncbi:nuclear transport factor 2 family protein [Sphingobacterium mizutaii]|uniref:nuclear transport factor 2 family protein n=1 Tax=Sphingobacterium mizutaii TaxID=1010 RepID=UPI001629F8A3|nr:nuclear transport factor 2 family protein [Sphingobacterium mizutaii]